MRRKILCILCLISLLALLICTGILLAAFSQLQGSLVEMDTLTQIFWVGYFLLRAPLFWGGLISLATFLTSGIWLLVQHFSHK